MTRHASLPAQYQSGNYALEYALVFPLLFLAIYTMLSFGMIYTAQQSLNMAAQEGARTLLRWWPDNEPDREASCTAWRGLATTQTTAPLELRAERARNCSLSHLAWLLRSTGPDGLQIHVCNRSGPLAGPTSPSCGAVPLAENEVEVLILYPYSRHPIVPELGLGRLFGISLLPDTLESRVRILAETGAAT
ncbi:TadE/TadG family type IV pilus assembly protein [Corticimicrobacter populi]|uniref:TadE-like domain-containing protein n=1 Tax=Corticimicrobacter populi TaxID=2175229 RepID=A0A2V1JYP4_9BURK|nr:TadE family protein [Corticimicrobacter populi]PWF22242.1 hypothetical protein DD235_12775 [Corticimicrobacter populi]